MFILEGSMIINKENFILVNPTDIYFHDDILNSVFFDNRKKEIILKCQKSSNQKDEYVVCFKNVIGFQMSSCDFWGASKCIFDFECVFDEDLIIIPYLMKEWTNIPQISPMPDFDNFIEILFTLTSGDKLRIACEYFVIDVF